MVLTMLSIFAIDPEICRNLEWFRYCIEHCQPSKGRVIADFPPGQWHKIAEPIIDQLIQELNLPPIKAQSLKNHLKMVQDQLVDRPGTVWTNWYYDPSQSSWIAEIEKEHRRDLFAAIISPEYEESDDERRQYHPDELNRTVTAWNTSSGITITRSPGEFVEAIMPMLRLALAIHFVDGHFDVNIDSSHTKNYKQIIEDLAKHRNTPDYPFPSLTIHCCPNSDEMTEKGKRNIEEGLEKHYAHLIPKGNSITVFAWQINDNVTIEKGNNPFHNRYVLSNHCGVIAGYGTDSYKRETAAPDVLQVIDYEIYLKLWNQIRDEAFPMIHIEEGNKFVIDGTKSA